MNRIPGLTISESTYGLSGEKKGKVAVFIYSGGGDPAKVLDLAIRAYVEDNGYYELIDANLDNPWMRVVVSNINEMSQEPFDLSVHRLITGI